MIYVGSPGDCLFQTLVQGILLFFLCFFHATLPDPFFSAAPSQLRAEGWKDASSLVWGKQQLEVRGQAASVWLLMTKRNQATQRQLNKNSLAATSRREFCQIMYTQSLQGQERVLDMVRGLNHLEPRGCAYKAKEVDGTLIKG